MFTVIVSPGSKTPLLFPPGASSEKATCIALTDSELTLETELNAFTLPLPSKLVNPGLTADISSQFTLTCSLTWSGVYDGNLPATSAATPAASGDAIDVPDKVA